MQLLLRLPFTLLEMVLRRGLRVVVDLRRLMRSGEDDDPFVIVDEPAPAPAPRKPAPPSPTPTRTSTPTPPPSGPPSTPLRDVSHVDRDAEVVASVGPAADVGAVVQIDEPWDGYDAMAASAIVTRLRGADSATKGVVRLYEQGHKSRATVLRASA